MPPSVRALYLADADIEDGKCHECGRPRDVCSDPHRDWYPQRSVCWATMARLRAEAAYQDLHGDAKYHNGLFNDWGTERSRKHPYQMSEGVSIWVSDFDFDPGDTFTTDKRAQPKACRPTEGEGVTRGNSS